MAAALELVCEVGYDRMSMDAIAARAHASKATMYRRWDSKAALVAESLRCRHHVALEPVDTGDVRGDLMAGLRRLAEGVRNDDLDLMTGLLQATRSDPELGRLIRHDMVESKRVAAQAWTARCVERGLLPEHANLDLFHQVAPSLIITRLLITGEPVDDAFLAAVVDRVLLPLFHHAQESAAPGSPPVRKDPS
ncbi:MAG TPA: TetR/AcrR family transcriptional regulator [Mycobacteriales bacterium]|nr:TetR/AcrR family transcriptional regulator [Mycobacteriales bacterium]